MLKKVRNSNIEILRIISVFIIILNHYAAYGGGKLTGSLAISALIIKFLHTGGKIGVNFFLFISGWYLCESEKINIRRPYYLATEVLLYSLIFSIFGIVLNTIGTKSIIKMILAIPYGNWEFITCYFMMISFSYWINKFIKAITIRQFTALMVFVFVVWCLFPTLTKADFGMSTLTWYIFIYMLAAYIKLIYNRIKLSSSKCFFIGIVSYLLILISEVLMEYIGTFISIFSSKSEHFRQLNSILVLFVTVFVFLGFEKMKPRNSFFVQKIASTSLAVFIIHDNGALREFIWNNIFHNSDYLNSPFLIVHALLTAIIIFVVCSVIDLIRQNTIARVEKKIVDEKLRKLELRLNDYLEGC